MFGFYLGKVGLKKCGKLPKRREDGQKFWVGGYELPISTEIFLLASFFHKLPNNNNKLLPDNTTLPTTDKICSAPPP